MKTKVTSQEQLDDLIASIPMIGNVYYRVDEYGSPIEYIPIDWKKEYVLITIINNNTTLERINYENKKIKSKTIS